jgi:RNA polymerase sigma-70 factor (ECF subfamily)
MHSNLKKDEDLINALKKGDTKAYTHLVNHYHHKLCVYAYSLTKDHNLSEDIVQNVFMSIWNKKSNLREDLVLKSYLYKSVYNEFVDQYRKQKPVLSLEKKHIDVLSEIIEEEDGNSMEKLIKLVKKEIENLPPKCKQTFLLSKQDGLTNIEIAEYLDVSLKSVEAHITKAFSILRKTVGDKVNSVLFLLFGLDIRKIGN